MQPLVGFVSAAGFRVTRVIFDFRIDVVMRRIRGVAAAEISTILNRKSHGAGSGSQDDRTCDNMSTILGVRASK
jgi:hypothetical protein